VKLFTLVLATVLPWAAAAQGFRSPAYCAQLADIGSNAYRTKVDGYPMNAVLQQIGFILADDLQKKQAAQGVVIAIYGDASIKSRKQAYDTVYRACKV
jgi:hypothetical protein